MWKPGQLVTLNGKVYRIHKTSYTSKQFICLSCSLRNIKPPCIEMNDYPDTKTCFGESECCKKIPLGCIPKHI